MKLSQFTKITTSLFILGAVYIAVNLIFFSGHRSIHERIGMVAGVTTTAEVRTNPINTAVEQIQKKDQELAQREQAVRERESAGSKKEILLTYVVVGEMALFFLIGLNIYLDLRRSKKSLHYR